MSFETLDLKFDDKICTLILNRPEIFNAMNKLFWKEIISAFNLINNSDSRVTIIKGSGKHFTSGIDLKDFSDLLTKPDEDIGRRANFLKKEITQMQNSFQAIDQAKMPVIASIHGACIGGGLDLISACDMRYASFDAFFSIHEINLGMIADVGTLQRLPKIIPDGVMREYAFSGKKFSAQEACEKGLINYVLKTKDELDRYVLNIAKSIRKHSPLVLSGTKEVLNFSRDNSINDGLTFVANLNSAMLQSNDLIEGIKAQSEKREPEYDDLKGITK